MPDYCLRENIFGPIIFFQIKFIFLPSNFALFFISSYILPSNFVLALALCYALVFRAKQRARARAKFEGKIYGEMKKRAKKRAKPETTRMPKYSSRVSFRAQYSFVVDGGVP